MYYKVQLFSAPAGAQGVKMSVRACMEGRFREGLELVQCRFRAGEQVHYMLRKDVKNV